MLEELEDPFTHIVAMELTISACPQIHSTPYATAVDFRIMQVYMEQNMKSLYKAQMIMVFPVLCVLLHHVRQC